MNDRLRFTTEFLSARGLSLGDLTTCVRPLAPSEALLLTGSVADGLAHAQSDINLTCVGEGPLTRDNAPGLLAPSTATPSSARALISMNYHQRLDVEHLLERVDRIAELMLDPFALAEGEGVALDVPSELELTLLHGLRTGIVLAQEDVVRSWRERLDVLPQLLLIHYLGSHFNCREDVIAQVKHGDPQTALWMLVPAADLMAGALLASVGDTHSDRRWRPRALRRHASEFDAARIDRLLSYMLPTLQDSDRADSLVRHAFAFFDVVVLDVFTRCPGVVDPIMELRKHAKFVTRFDEVAP